ncbi:Lon protease (S16) C-terminal proteolytic domain-containing protein [Psychrobacillus sp. OK028]|uniref:S16 family serine protease n=1 Tax=Psychrobacillus sp. OK028 TaxID=1884359 RepID=UPI0008845C12|nr:S16 family serine protease [Psychrobacillus sp. OK028]SDN12534.1 Lon protease (S16) C-terminal proteolytic domain-containing protein [Psychrobacillus sp. OK028]
MKIIESVNKHQMIPFVMTMFVYFADLYLYLLDYISNFFFWIILFLLVILWSFFLFSIRKTQISKHTFVFTLIASLFLLVYEFPILSVKENNYFVLSYLPPEELIKNTGIYILPVKSIEIQQQEPLNEPAFRNFHSHLLILDIIKGTNFQVYSGKTSFIYKLVGINLEEDYFHQMSVNVKSYLNTSNPAIDEFLSRNNSGGNSAGLALVLSSLVEQGKFKNNIPIGVTGAISKTGKAIEIGLTKEKILSANKIGLSYIILPIGNLEEGNDVVKSLNLPIEVIGVRNVDEAIEQINELNKDLE